MSDSAYTILIAEDDDSIRHALTDVLTASGYEVLALEEGLAAIHAVRERNFDLALLDVAMPGADGFQVLQVMSEERPGTPVIMLTARGEEEDRVQGSSWGRTTILSSRSASGNCSPASRPFCAGLRNGRASSGKSGSPAPPWTAPTA